MQQDTINQMAAACFAVLDYSNTERSDWPAVRGEVVRAVEMIERDTSATTVPQVEDSHVAAEDVPRLNAQCLAVLRMLRADGSATSVQLCQVTHRFGARIYDLRRAGHVITKRSLGGGINLYCWHHGPPCPALEND